MFSSYLNFAIEHSDSYRVMYTVAQPEPGQYTELETEISRSTDPIGQVVNSSVTAETMIGDPVNICYVLWAGIHGLISLHLAHMQRDKREIQELAAAMVSSLIRGCSAETGQSPVALIVKPS